MAYETVNPANGECLRRFEEHSDAEVTAALNAAYSAHRTWRQESFEGRARLVRRVADLMRERIEPLSALITLEMGKLPAESRGGVDAMWIDEDGRLLMPASQLDRTPPLNGGRDAARPPLTIFTADLDLKSVRR